eukprot:2569280-Pleurochrysis_carterae.AAC.2
MLRVTSRLNLGDGCDAAERRGDAGRWCCVTFQLLRCGAAWRWLLVCIRDGAAPQCATFLRDAQLCARLREELLRALQEEKELCSVLVAAVFERRTRSSPLK